MNSNTIVVLQPQFFPWLGVFEQIALSDTFVHFDDVQLPQGRSFCSRVQIKTSQGIQWLTVPVTRRQGQLILETQTDDGSEWQRKQLATLGATLSRYPFKDDAIDIVQSVFKDAGSSLAEINILGIERISKYLGFTPKFLRSSQMATSGSKDDRLLSILEPLQATRYVSGMGGLTYIDHQKFERRGIRVEYMNYALIPYPQQHGEFTPYVSALDAIAALGSAASDLILARSRWWKEVVVA